RPCASTRSFAKLKRAASTFPRSSRLSTSTIRETMLIPLCFSLMNTPSPEQLAKLPKWAQDHITKLERQREEAIRTLNQALDTQTESSFSVVATPCTGETTGPSFKRAYVQAHSIEVRWRGVELTVDANDYGQNGKGIRLQWSGKHDSD